MAPCATASRKRRTHGSPVSPARRSQTVMRAPRSCSDCLHRRAGIGRDEHVERPVGGARDHRRGERGIAAGGDGEPARAQAVAGRQPGDLQHAQIEHHPHEVARLVRAGHVAGLVLDPQRILQCPAPRASPVLLDIGVTRKPRPSTATSAASSCSDDLAPGRVGKTGRARQPVGRQQRPIAQERIWLASRSGMPRPAAPATST